MSARAVLSQALSATQESSREGESERGRERATFSRPHLFCSWRKNKTLLLLPPLEYERIF